MAEKKEITQEIKDFKIQDEKEKGVIKIKDGFKITDDATLSKKEGA